MFMLRTEATGSKRVIRNQVIILSNIKVIQTGMPNKKHHTPLNLSIISSDFDYMACGDGRVNSRPYSVLCGRSNGTSSLQRRGGSFRCIHHPSISH